MREHHHREGAVSRAARKLLSTPKGYLLEDILFHLETCLTETEEYYGIK